MVMTISARDFARDLAGAKRAAAEGPVFITDRGTPVYALLRIEDYYALSGDAQAPSLLDVLQGMPGTEGVDFEPPRLEADLPPVAF